MDIVKFKNMNIDNNTLSTISTKFLRGVELINTANLKFNMPNENWCYPYLSYGDADFDNYYAEIWYNGMDYNRVYWLIEYYDFKDPEVNPLLIIDNDELNKFNNRSFKKLLKYLVCNQRNIKWIKHSLDTWKCYFEEIYVYLQNNEFVHSDNLDNFIQFEFEHASQEKVIFYINSEFVV